MELLTYHNLITLFSLILLQFVLGLDNLLYIAIESKRVRGQNRILHHLGACQDLSTQKNN